MDVTAAFSPVAIDDEFVPRELHEEPVHAIARSAATAAFRVYRGENRFAVAVSELVIDEMLAFGRRAAPLEWYALLVGRLCEDSDGKYVVVDAAVLDTGAIASTGSIETTLESEQRLRALAQVQHPVSIPIGWGHGHHRCGSRFSATDRKNQATWTQEHSVGIVVDPWDAEPVGVYRGPRSERLAEVRPRAGGRATAPARTEETSPAPRTTAAPTRLPRPPRFPLLALLPRSVRRGLFAGLVICTAGLAGLVHELRAVANRVEMLEGRLGQLATKDATVAPSAGPPSERPPEGAVTHGPVVPPFEVATPRSAAPPAPSNSITTPSPASAPPDTDRVLPAPPKKPVTPKKRASQPRKTGLPAATPKDGGS